MEEYTPSLEPSDYRTFLTHYDQSHIWKIEVAASDVATLLSTFRDEMARIARPDSILLTVDVPSADKIRFSDMVSLLACVAGSDNCHPNVCWEMHEQSDVPAVRVVAYVGFQKEQISKK